MKIEEYRKKVLFVINACLSPIPLEDIPELKKAHILVTTVVRLSDPNDICDTLAEQLNTAYTLACEYENRSKWQYVKF